ncbi:unnamed protein product [Brassicogethes aeneus]|uniref:Uncharacterized protein n=1 Tax=Brassicogethes aeneus TaxID=1431903 RepID=A0A9P0BJE3_BRAAE|nr:unnamed protein product [Brassicogethes aeneus]
MCLVNDITVKNMPTRSPRSPWRRTLREPIKPRLSRKIITSARVNLNSYWSKFEATSKPSMLDIDISHLLSSRVSSSENEITDNIINELMELGNK